LALLQYNEAAAGETGVFNHLEIFFFLTKRKNERDSMRELEMLLSLDCLHTY
jgi:hypothetical protein